MGCQKTCTVEKLLRPPKEVALNPKQRLATTKKRNRMRGTGKLKNEVLPLHRVDNFCLLEDNPRALQLNRETLNQQRLHQKLLETEISTRRKECEALEAEVKKKNQTCQTLENELQGFLQENKHLNLQWFNSSHKAAEYEKVKSEYAQLKEALGVVTQERDLALWERNQLQGKLENLEQVLKHMREAAERRQQLELEHEQALAVLTAKQQEIDLLQKAQVEAKKEHEGAVHLLENHLDSMQAKVRELEEKCRSQSEQFNLLSKELEKFRLQAGKFDILSCEPLTLSESPGSPNKSLSQLLNGLAAPTEKKNEAPTSRSLISEFIRPLQISGDKPELLSVKPTFLSRSRASSPARAFLSEMDKELSSTTRSKPRFTGKVRLCVARYSYNPYDGPNEHPEAELPLVAGKYLYVYGTMDEDGFYEGELLDGQRGLVPSNFVDFVDDEEKPSVPHRETVAKEPGYLNHSSLGPQRLLAGTGTRTALSSLLSDSKLDCLSTGSLGVDLLGSSSNGTGTLDVNIDEVGEDIVPYPRRITLIKQLAKSVIIGWDPPVVPPGWGSISGYNVLVDKEVRMSVPYGGRTKSLIEKLNLVTNTYRISVQSITDRGPSDELRCTVLVGKDVVVAPYYLRVDSITQCSAELSWMPSNSNYSHTIFLNGAEYDMVKAGGYKYKFFNLKPMTVYKVKVVAQPHQVPWQLPVDQREKREISVEFCTQPSVCTSFSGPPLPPQEVQVQCGQTPGVLQVRWKPPPLTPSGTSNGASVIGYAVCTKGQKVEKRNFFSERGNALHPINSDEEEDGYDSPHSRRRGASVDEFLRGSELGRQHYHHHYSHSEDYHTESSRGSDLSDIMEEDEEDLYSEMQLEEGRRRSINSHSTLKAYYKRQDLAEERDCWDLQREVVKQRSLRSKRLHSIPEVAEEESDSLDSTGQHLSFEEGRRPGTPHTQRRMYPPETHNHLTPGKNSRLQRQRSSPRFTDSRYGYSVDDRNFGRPSRQNTKSPDSGLDCGSEEEGSLGRGHRGYYAHGSPIRGPVRIIHCEGPVERRALAMGRKRTLTRQCSVEEEFSDVPVTVAKSIHTGDFRNREHFGPSREVGPRNYSREGALSEGRLNELDRVYYSPHREARAQSLSRLNRDQPLIIGNSPSHGSHDRLDHSGRRPVHIGTPPQRRPIPSIEITMDSNSEGSEGNLSPVKEDVYYGSVAGRRIWRSLSSEDQYDGYSGCRHGRGRRSPDYFEELEPEDLTRVFVALFDYDPLSMSPNPDAADEELPFKEGQIIKVFGNKDTDGFYRAEIRGRVGLIPCNMVSEIQTEDDEMMDQLLKQGFLPLNTPVEKLVNCDRFKDGRSINRRSRKSKRERNRRSGRQYPMSTRRMVALYDYDPRESSPNVDVEYEGNRLNEEAELTFCAGDVIMVFGEIDEDGFYYGELNGHKGLVPSNFLEEVPDDVEVFLTDSPSRYPQDTPARIKTKRKKSVHFTP
ncbi:RIMS-binding protein 2 isoform X12 [Kryptolebias marmoratus]|uniref:RIMS-binding protein 2 isoform X12 n=1 Tax=Kryptolebias marmoratus TaxID=37003 RepID=UPI0018ACEDCF|nr:RIMS-binding protein 2 isoform X12 [Kryptolebias marmoratus]